jgi:hypothetical protein
MNQSPTRTSVIRISLCKSIALLAIVALSISATGCSTMTSLTNTELPVDAAAAGNGSYSVEMHPNFGSPKQYKGTLTGSTTVSEALTKSGAIKKFRGMEVEILRVVEHKGKSRGLRMPVKYQRSLMGPTPEQDYALLDGDRIVIKPDGGSSITKVLSSMVGG